MTINTTPHRDPWWSCYGCWKVIAVTLAVAVWAGLVLHNLLCGK